MICLTAAAALLVYVYKSESSIVTPNIQSNPSPNTQSNLIHRDFERFEKTENSIAVAGIEPSTRVLSQIVIIFPFSFPKQRNFISAIDEAVSKHSDRLMQRFKLTSNSQSSSTETSQTSIYPKLTSGFPPMLGPYFCALTTKQCFVPSFSDLNPSSTTKNPISNSQHEKDFESSVSESEQLKLFNSRCRCPSNLPISL